MKPVEYGTLWSVLIATEYGHDRLKETADGCGQPEDTVGDARKPSAVGDVLNMR